jgi:hypothetical protein
MIDRRSTSTLARALELAKLGIRVFPCRHHLDKAIDKTPLVDKWPKKASTDPDAIREMWPKPLSLRDPWTLIGVPIGYQFVVIDIDPRQQRSSMA